jgi:dipeptidase E
MKLFLSSFRLGDDPGRFSDLLGSDGPVAFVPNALDVLDASIREKVIVRGMADLHDAGCSPVVVDLRAHYGQETLEAALSGFGACFVAGGNVFVLRRAMRQAGLDTLLQARSFDPHFLYAGYSAGACIAGPNLDGLHLVDDPEAVVEGYRGETIWSGLGLVDYRIIPHYDSEHPESLAMNEVVRYCAAKKLEHRTLRDGEVIVCEHQGSNPVN